MRKMLSAALCAALLLGLAPIAAPPARMIEGAIVAADKSSVYVGDTVTWHIMDFAGAASPVQGSVRIYRGAGHIATLTFLASGRDDIAFVTFTPYAPLRHIAGAYMIEPLSNTAAYSFSAPVQVAHRPAPKSVRAEAVSGTSLRVTWDAVPGATGYEVWRAEFKAGPYAPVRTTPATTWSNTGLTPGKLYWYKVRSTNYISTSGFTGTVASEVFSAPAAGIPLAKAAIQSATATGKDRVKLVLTAVPGASGYEVQVSSTAGGTYRVLRKVSATTFTITGLTPNTAYYFKVRAYRTVSAGTFFGALSGYRGVRTLK
ncbi:MAG TPA: fibronectin type III domain-containing protein [Candidatus Limnocylindria bacterium]|nr:fibronectin type III domain-containing protein [Candidatus Limnocylindria bacterium]